MLLCYLILINDRNVYKSTGSWYTVKTLNGKLYECRIKGKFQVRGIKSTNPIAVGDIVDFELETKNNTETESLIIFKSEKIILFENQ